MDKSFVLVWLDALYAWLVRYAWLLQWRTVARPVNLAQASQSRLGEMKQGARLGLLHERSPRRPARTFERGNTSPRREGSRLSEIPWCSLSAPSNPRLGERGARLSEHVSPERNPSAWARGWARQYAVWVLVYFWMIDFGLGVNCMMRNMYIMEYYACLAWITNCVWRVGYVIGMWNVWEVWN